MNSQMTALGAAHTPDDFEVEKAIRAVRAWEHCEVSYAALPGGLTNHNWRIKVSGTPSEYFLKIPGEGTNSFIDRKVAYSASLSAARLGIGPEVFWFDPGSGIQIDVFLDGYRCCTNLDFVKVAIQEEAVELYRQFHEAPMLSLTKTFFDWSDEHLEQAKKLNALFPTDIGWLLYNYEAARRAFNGAGFDLVPCFNDPMPGNFLVCADRPMKLIDYESASNNERAYELGIFAGEMFLDEPQTLHLIEKYYGEVRSELVARVYVCRAIADFKWATWAIVNRRLKDWEFDYQKYGTLKYMRARRLFGDSRWDNWLRSL